jgi:hypothetical protein
MYFKPDVIERMKLIRVSSQGYGRIWYSEIHKIFLCFKIIRLVSYISRGAEWSRDRSVGIASGWMAGVRFPVGARYLLLLHSVQTGSGAHLASYLMGNGGDFLRE